MKTTRDFLVRPYLYLLIILIGIFMKFFQLDYKLFWFDEVSTIQHTSGISDRDYPSLIPVGEVKNIDFYIDLYHLDIQNLSFGSELRGLLTSTQLNPLHYPFLMIWYRLVGDNPSDFRLFSVFIFIISLPFLFLLSMKLFNSRLAGWIAVSLYSISPYIHLFSQEARYYIFWSFILIVMHYLFLQVIHHNKTKWWILYILISALSLYASPISILIIFGHSVFIGLTRKDIIKKYCLSILFVLTLYLPWALSLYFKFDEINSALSWQSNNEHNVNFLLPFIGQLLYFISIFSFKLDYLSVFEQASFNITPEAMSAFIFNMVILIIICISIFFLFKKTSKEISYFLLLIIIPGLVFFYINDIIRNGMTSWWWRYLIFISPGVFLVMTNLLYRKIEKGSFIYFVIFLGIALIGISSITSIAKARHWHIGNKLNTYIESANFISKAEKPLLITDFNNDKSMVDFVVIMQECTSDNIDILRVKHDNESLISIINLEKYSDIYVLYPSDKLISNLKTQFGNNMDSLNIADKSSIWTIKTKDLKTMDF